MRSSISKTPRKQMKSQFSPSPRKSIIKEHKIHNQDKLKVFVKFKPQTLQQKCHQKCVSYINQNQLEIQTSISKKIYTFDHVFDPTVNTQSVFSVGCRQLMSQVIEGVEQDRINNNGLVFVYGNTGTGKTYTMGLINEMSNDSKGLVPDALRYIFHNNSIQQVCLSFCQIYKDEVYDLLDFGEERKLNIRENNKSKQPYIQDLIVIQVKNFNQASQLINIGLEKRKIAEQKVNNRSSRGHGVITFYFKNTNSQNTGRVCFVDLAGCERIKESESKGATLNQALFINTSLSALQTLLMNISDQNVRSYRSNKLTRLLQPYFQFGKIRLFVTSNYDSTQSIEFAKRCKGIKFHQRQIRRQTEQKVHRSPRKTQKTSQKTSSKVNQRIEQIKRQFLQRQNTYLKCISNLISIIKKINQSISTSLTNQSIHSSFSLPQLFQHIPLQSKVNSKINIFQKKQQDILAEQKENDNINTNINVNPNANINTNPNQNDNQNQKNYSKISSQLSTNLSQINDDMNTVLQRTQEIMKTSQEIGFMAIKKITRLSLLTEYKNVYKKQWFTSEIKNGLLENKNDQFQKAIVFLMQQLSKFINHTSANPQLQAKISKKLKEYGIVLAEENSMSKSSKILPKAMVQNKSNTSKVKTPRKSLSIRKNDEHNISESHNHSEYNDDQNSQKLSNRSRKRSLIYIDEQ